MGDPYSDVTVLNYNDDAPPDDGSEVPANRVTWAIVKQEIGDPLKDAIESLNTNIGDAVDKLVGGAGVTSTTAPYTVQTSDQGKLVRVTTTGTLTTADAAAVATPFVHFVLNASSGTLTVDGSGSQTVDGEENITLPAGAGVTLFTDGSNWFTAGRGNTQGSNSFVIALPRGYIDGLTTSNNSTDSDHDIDIAAGVARDSSNSFDFENSSTHVKRIDASWASGSGNGGLASGVSLSADNTYHLFAVDDGDGNTEFGFDTSLTASNLLSDTGGSFFRMIWSVLTDGDSNIRAFIQHNETCLLVDPIATITGQTGHTSPTLRQMDVPSGLAVEALLTGGIDRGEQTIGLHVTTPGVTSGVASAGSGTGNNIVRAVASVLSDGTGHTAVAAQFSVHTNASRQVLVSTNDNAGDYAITTRGWVHPRGRDD